jgi:hypothetical protein
MSPGARVNCFRAWAETSTVLSSPPRSLRRMVGWFCVVVQPDRRGLLPRCLRHTLHVTLALYSRGKGDMAWAALLCRSKNSRNSPQQAAKVALPLALRGESGTHAPYC